MEMQTQYRNGRSEFEEFESAEELQEDLIEKLNNPEVEAMLILKDGRKVQDDQRGRLREFLLEQSKRMQK